MKAVRLCLFMFVLLTVPVLAYCSHSKSVDVATVRADPSKHDRITSVTLSNGREITFDRSPPPVLLSDTLRGMAHGVSASVPMDSVQRVWVSSVDAVRTTLAVVGVAVGVAAVIAAVAASQPPKINTPSQSCPFVYSWDGQRYVFEAEPYGGAITRGLERDDYGELPSLVADHGEYRLLVANEVNETQYTNQLQLMVVDHAPGITIKADEFGRFYAFDALRGPSAAHDQDGRDLRPWFAASSPESPPSDLGPPARSRPPISSNNRRHSRTHDWAYPRRWSSS